MVSAAHIRKTRSYAVALPSQWVAAGLAVAYVLLALWWSVVVPIGEGPDEPGHFDYALFLAREERLPVQGAGQAAGEVPGEGHQPPLAYWLMQPAVGWLSPAEQTLEMGPNPEFWPAGDEANAYLRSSRDIWPYSGIGRAWHWARAVSALLGGATVALTFAVARRCLPQHPTIALGAAALVAFNPQFIFAGALVSNDPLLFALSALLLLLCVTIAGNMAASPRRTLGYAAAAGVVLGLLLITKQSAVALAPLPFVALAVRATVGRTHHRQSLWRVPTVVFQALLMAGIALAVAGWWYTRNLRLYGDLFGLDAFRETFALGGGDIAFAGVPGGLWALFRSGWGNFGWLTVPLPEGLYRALLAFCALGAAGLLAAVGQGWWAKRGPAALLLLATTGFVCSWTAGFAMVAGPVAWQGRFLFPAIGALATGLAAGLGAVLPRRSALWTLLALLVLLAATAPGGVIAPRYRSFVRPAQPADWGNTRARLSLPWKRGAEVRNAGFAARAPSGGTLDVVVTWHVLEQLDADYLVFVHLVNAAGDIVAEHNAPPKAGRFPTSSWVRGDWIEDTQQVRLAGVAPGTYQVYLGLWNEQDNRTLPAVDDAGNVLDWRHAVGWVEVTK